MHMHVTLHVANYAECAAYMNSDHTWQSAVGRSNEHLAGALWDPGISRDEGCFLVQGSKHQLSVVPKMTSL